MNEVGEGQPEEASNLQNGEECQGGAYGVSLGTYGGHVETISSAPKPTPKPIVATINDSAILTHKTIRDRGIGKTLAREIVLSCFWLGTLLEE